MQACVDWVLIIFGTQVIKKKRPVLPVFPDYLSVSYGYGETKPQLFLPFSGKQGIQLLSKMKRQLKRSILSNVKTYVTCKSTKLSTQFPVKDKFEHRQHSIF